MQLYLLAADNGSFNAQNNIGTMYYFGRGVTQSYTKAFEWYKKAAEQDVGLAQFNLGDLYEQGQGVPQDYEKAFEWYKKAADQGNQEASNRIGRLVMDNKIDDEGIIIYSTEDTGLTLGDIE
ncbi:tetratricopeptide repeat protein [uncultured Psychrobacter sp.]|uniref:tetratricopeptide repeat protein n=1 Tax=uncultured Psychrobacter sp. TaxID=259303 RepID=UPI003458D197